MNLLDEIISIKYEIKVLHNYKVRIYFSTGKESSNVIKVLEKTKGM